ncbi:MAG: hypothetical protein V4568_04730 [Pseudomonadota bacterium]
MGLTVQALAFQLGMHPKWELFENAAENIFPGISAEERWENISVGKSYLAMLEGDSPFIDLEMRGVVTKIIKSSLEVGEEDIEPQLDQLNLNDDQNYLVHLIFETLRSNHEERKKLPEHADFIELGSMAFGVLIKNLQREQVLVAASCIRYITLSQVFSEFEARHFHDAGKLMKAAISGSSDEETDAFMQEVIQHPKWNMFQVASDEITGNAMIRTLVADVPKIKFYQGILAVSIDSSDDLLSESTQAWAVPLIHETIITGTNKKDSRLRQIPVKERELVEAIIQGLLYSAKDETKIPELLKANYRELMSDALEAFKDRESTVRRDIVRSFLRVDILPKLISDIFDAIEKEKFSAVRKLMKEVIRDELALLESPSNEEAVGKLAQYMASHPRWGTFLSALPKIFPRLDIKKEVLVEIDNYEALLTVIKNDQVWVSSSLFDEVRKRIIASIETGDAVVLPIDFNFDQDEKNLINGIASSLRLMAQFRGSFAFPERGDVDTLRMLSAAALHELMMLTRKVITDGCLQYLEQQEQEIDFEPDTFPEEARKAVSNFFLAIKSKEFSKAKGLLKEALDGVQSEQLDNDAAITALSYQIVTHQDWRWFEQFIGQIFPEVKVDEGDICRTINEQLETLKNKKISIDPAHSKAVVAYMKSLAVGKEPERVPGFKPTPTQVSLLNAIGSGLRLAVSTSMIEELPPGIEVEEVRAQLVSVVEEIVMNMRTELVATYLRHARDNAKKIQSNDALPPSITVPENFEQAVSALFSAIDGRRFEIVVQLMKGAVSNASQEQKYALAKRLVKHPSWDQFEETCEKSLSGVLQSDLDRKVRDNINILDDANYYALDKRAQKLVTPLLQKAVKSGDRKPGGDIQLSSKERSLVDAVYYGVLRLPQDKKKIQKLEKAKFVTFREEALTVLKKKEAESRLERALHILDAPIVLEIVSDFFGAIERGDLTGAATLIKRGFRNGLPGVKAGGELEALKAQIAIYPQWKLFEAVMEKLFPGMRIDDQMTTVRTVFARDGAQLAVLGDDQILIGFDKRRAAIETVVGVRVSPLSTFGSIGSTGRRLIEAMQYARDRKAEQGEQIASTKDADFMKLRDACFGRLESVIVSGHIDGLSTILKYGQYLASNEGSLDTSSVSADGWKEIKHAISDIFNQIEGEDFYIVGTLLQIAMRDVVSDAEHAAMAKSLVEHPQWDLFEKAGEKIAPGFPKSTMPIYLKTALDDLEDESISMRAIMWSSVWSVVKTLVETGKEPMYADVYDELNADEEKLMEAITHGLKQMLKADGKEVLPQKMDYETAKRESMRVLKDLQKDLQLKFARQSLAYVASRWDPASIEIDEGMASAHLTDVGQAKRHVFEILFEIGSGRLDKAGQIMKDAVRNASGEQIAMLASEFSKSSKWLIFEEVYDKLMPNIARSPDLLLTRQGIVLLESNAVSFPPAQQGELIALLHRAMKTENGAISSADASSLSLSSDERTFLNVMARVFFKATKVVPSRPFDMLRLAALNSLKKAEVPHREAVIKGYLEHVSSVVKSEQRLPAPTHSLTFSKPLFNELIAVINKDYQIGLLMQGFSNVEKEKRVIKMFNDHEVLCQSDDALNEQNIDKFWNAISPLGLSAKEKHLAQDLFFYFATHRDPANFPLRDMHLVMGNVLLSFKNERAISAHRLSVFLSKEGFLPNDIRGWHVVLKANSSWQELVRLMESTDTTADIPNKKKLDSLMYSFKSNAEEDAAMHALKGYFAVRAEFGQLDAIEYWKKNVHENVGFSADACAFAEEIRDHFSNGQLPSDIESARQRALASAKREWHERLTSNALEKVVTAVEVALQVSSVQLPFKAIGDIPAVTKGGDDGNAQDVSLDDALENCVALIVSVEAEKQNFQSLLNTDVDLSSGDSEKCMKIMASLSKDIRSRKVSDSNVLEALTSKAKLAKLKLTDLQKDGLGIMVSRCVNVDIAIADHENIQALKRDVIQSYKEEINSTDDELYDAIVIGKHREELVSRLGGELTLNGDWDEHLRANDQEVAEIVDLISDKGLDEELSKQAVQQYKTARVKIFQLMEKNNNPTAITAAWDRSFAKKISSGNRACLQEMGSYLAEKGRKFPAEPELLRKEILASYENKITKEKDKITKKYLEKLVERLKKNKKTAALTDGESHHSDTPAANKQLREEASAPADASQKVEVRQAGKRSDARIIAGNELKPSIARTPEIIAGGNIQQPDMNAMEGILKRLVDQTIHAVTVLDEPKRAAQEVNAVANVDGDMDRFAAMLVHEQRWQAHMYETIFPNIASCIKAVKDPIVEDNAAVILKQMGGLLKSTKGEKPKVVQEKFAEQFPSSAFSDSDSELAFKRLFQYFWTNKSEGLPNDLEQAREQALEVL